MPSAVNFIVFKFIYSRTLTHLNVLLLIIFNALNALLSKKLRTEQLRLIFIIRFFEVGQMTTTPLCDKFSVNYTVYPIRYVTEKSSVPLQAKQNVL